MILRRAQLERIQNLFKRTYEKEGTEDRVLIYRTESGGLLMVYPKAKREPGMVECDVPLTVIHKGKLYDLILDLHSHHIMGTFFSATDDANERIRGVIFGVFSWKDGVDTWRFRRFNGADFVDVGIEEVVNDLGVS